MTMTNQTNGSAFAMPTSDLPDTVPQFLTKEQREAGRLKTSTAVPLARAAASEPKGEQGKGRLPVPPRRRPAIPSVPASLSIEDATKLVCEATKAVREVGKDTKAYAERERKRLQREGARLARGETKDGVVVSGPADVDEQARKGTPKGFDPSIDALVALPADAFAPRGQPSPPLGKRGCASNPTALAKLDEALKPKPTATRGITSPAGKQVDPATRAAIKRAPKSVNPTKQESTMRKTATINKSTKSKARKSVKGKTTSKKAPAANATARPDGLKAGSKLALLADTVCRPAGATEAELNKVLGWAACLVTLRRVAERCEIKLKQGEDEKTGKTRYFGTAKARKSA